jgi:ankyrin repeat protein
MLLDHGANIYVEHQDKNGQTVLMRAMGGNSFDMLVILLVHPGINVDRQDNSGHAALMLCCQQNSSSSSIFKRQHPVV